MGFHLAKEGHHTAVCTNCRSETRFEHSKSEFVDDFHYKSASCHKCGSKVWAKVDFMGTGHDEWGQKSRRMFELRTTEERVAFRKINGWLEHDIIHN